MGDVGDAIIRGGNPNDPNFGKAPANGKGRPRNIRIDHISFGIQPCDADAVKEGLEKRGLRAQIDTGNTGDIHEAALQELSHPDAQPVQPADELRHQGNTADRIQLDEAGAVGRQPPRLRSASVL